ncbi:hypothetical protein EC968_004050, partial [Mortierella alpina]
DGGMDHYPPPDQWNYTMTRYHASLIPLCQIEEPPTFYEGMDDHPPVETDNDDSDSFFLEDRDIRERGVDKSRDKERVYNNSDENISLTSIAKPHPQTSNYSHHDHTSHSQEHLQQHQERRRLQLHDEAREGNESHVLQASEGQSYRTSMAKDDSESKGLDKETVLPLTKQQQRRRDRTIDSSGEQIFFYDGPNLLHAKLHSGGYPDPVKSEGSAGPRFHSSTEPFDINNDQSKKIQIPLRLQVEIKVNHRKQRRLYTLSIDIRRLVQDSLRIFSQEGLIAVLLPAGNQNTTQHIDERVLGRLGLPK